MAEFIHRYKCSDCEEMCRATDILHADNPFDPEDMVDGCPHCKAVNSLDPACDIDGCRQLYSNGTPMPDGGYTWRCIDHNPARIAND